MGPRSSDRGYGPIQNVTWVRVGSFNGSTVLRPWLCTGGLKGEVESIVAASMGPRSSDRGYAPRRTLLRWPRAASMGPRSSDRGYGEELERLRCEDLASMGPRSSDRGYDVEPATVNFGNNPLQWVHGPQTVVMQFAAIYRFRLEKLQWVHGPQTVVMSSKLAVNHRNSTGFNGSTVLRPWLWTIQNYES